LVLRTSDGARDRPPVKPPSCSRGRHMARPIVRALVSVPVAELRRRPSHASELVTQALLGEPLEIATRTADRKWFRVKRWDGYRGWTRAWSVTPVSVAASEQWEAGLRVLVAARSARVMDAPGGLGRVVFELPLGTRLPELAHRGTWVRVALPDGRAGWVRGSLLAAIPVRPQGQASVLRAAREFTGAPYLWGGITPWGCDCSALGFRATPQTNSEPSGRHYWQNRPARSGPATCSSSGWTAGASPTWPSRRAGSSSYTPMAM